MKKIICFLILNAILFGYSRAYAKGEIYRSETLAIHRISERVYVHVSYLHSEEWGTISCNGMIVADNGEAVVFDTTTDGESSAELIDWIKTALQSDVVAVVPTHYHDDNLGGLNEFHRRGIPSYAYRKTLDITRENGGPQPRNAFDSMLELQVGSETVAAGFFGEGHTCDNAIGYFPSENILFGGCLVKEAGAGKGNLAEANPGEWAQTVRKVMSNYPEAKVVVPGHGQWGGMELLNYTIHLFE